MAEEGRPIDVTAFGDERPSFAEGPVPKGSVDLLPKQFILRCDKVEIISQRDGTTCGTRIFIDGKPAYGIYDILFHFNTNRPTQMSFSVFLGKFQFDLVPKKPRPKEEREYGSNQNRRLDGEG
jgi:hypothetical protein